MERLIRLARGKNGFFCPVSRFHLIGGVKPQDVYPAGLPLSDAVKRGLQFGGLIDVSGSFQEELNGVKPSVDAPVATATVGADNQPPTPPVTPPQQPQEPQAPVTPPAGDGNEFDYETAVSLTLEQIESATKKQLVAFIEGNSIDLVDLDLNSRSKEDDYKEALKKYFELA